MKRQFLLPDPGEGLTEAEIVAWRVTVGQEVEVNDVLVEIETAKSLVELPSPYAGTVTSLLVAEGVTVEVGTAIVEIEDGVEGGGEEPPTLVGYGPRDEAARSRRRRRGYHTGYSDGSPRRVRYADERSSQYRRHPACRAQQRKRHTHTG